MQHTIRPWITAAVALAGTGVIVVTPVVAPDTEHHAVTLTTLDQDIADLEQILAGLIDPGLAGAAAQTTDTAAATDLGGTDLSSHLASTTTNGDSAATFLAGAEQRLTESSPDYVDAKVDDDLAHTYVGGAAFDAGLAHTDIAQVVAELSASADPIEVFEADLQTDWSQLLSDPLSSTMLTDLTATLNAAPGAAQEFLAELIDPAAAGQVTAYDDANAAAELEAIAQQQYGLADTALTAAHMADATTSTGDQTIAAATDTAVSAVSTANADFAQSSTDVTDAVEALSSATPTATVADLGTELGSLWSDLLTALGL